MTDTPRCLHCECTSDEVPLLQLRFKGKEVWICPQHLPVLIHKPAELAHKLPGLEKLHPGQH